MEDMLGFDKYYIIPKFMIERIKKAEAQIKSLMDEGEMVKFMLKVDTEYRNTHAGFRAGFSQLAHAIKQRIDKL